MHQPLSDSERANTIFFSPNSSTYAVIRMNPIAMVKDLNDPEALSAAEALPTKAYLIYIDCVRVIQISVILLRSRLMVDS